MNRRLLAALSVVFLVLFCVASDQAEISTELSVRRLIEVELPTVVGVHYQLQHSSSPLPNSKWIDVGEPFVGTGETLHVGSRQSDRKGFFRVLKIDREVEENGTMLGGILSVFPDSSETDEEEQEQSSPPILTIINDLAEPGLNEEPPGFVRFVKFYKGLPTGDVMQEGDGSLVLARKLAAIPKSNFVVQRVRITIEK